MNQLWPKSQILDALRSGAKPIVIKYPDGNIKDLSLHAASKLDGDYQVSISPHEIIVRWHPPAPSQK